MTEPVFKINATPMLGALDKLEGAIVNTAPLLRIAGNIMVGSIHQTMRDEGSPAGSWRRLYASTMRQQFESRGKRKPMTF